MARVDLAHGTVFALIVALVAIGLFHASAKEWRRVRLRARVRRAEAGERAAEPLLERAGYRIRGRQVRATLEYALDGAPVPVEVRADYVVERGGESLVAEVKTGRDAPRLETRATRRQLLEYAHAFGASGVLLVDPERGRVHRVGLPERMERTRHARDALCLGLGVLLGVALAALASALY